MYVVRFKSKEDRIKGIESIAQIDSVDVRPNSIAIINRRQLEELSKLEVSYELLSQVQRTPFHKITNENAEDEVHVGPVKIKLEEGDAHEFRELIDLGPVRCYEGDVYEVSSEILKKLAEKGVPFTVVEDVKKSEESTNTTAKSPVVSIKLDGSEGIWDLVRAGPAVIDGDEGELVFTVARGVLRKLDEKGIKYSVVKDLKKQAHRIAEYYKP